MPAMVQDAKHVAINPADTAAVSRWRESNKAVSYIRYKQSDYLIVHFFFVKQLLNAVGKVRQAVQIHPELPPLPDINSLNLGKQIRHSYTRHLQLTSLL